VLSALLDLVHHAFSLRPDPPREVVLGAAAVAVAVVIYGPVWRLARYFITLAHEGGHALIAVLTGRRLSGIKLHSDTSGLTVSRGKPTGPGMVLTGLAGYPTPPLLGLGAAALLLAGRVTLLLLICMALLPLVLIMIRNFFGVLSVLSAMVIVFGIAGWAPVPIQGAFGYFFAWFLLFGGLRAVIELQGARRAGTAPHSDADQAARLTRVPALLWVGIFLTVAAFSLLIGGRWLLNVVLVD
jgi:hypothetical protein